MNVILRRTILALCGVAVVAGVDRAQAQSLPAPADLESTPPAPGKILLSWDAVAGATSYNIYRSTTSGGEGTTPVANTTGTSYTDTGLTNGPPPVYYYTVAAVNAGGVGPQSAETATPTPLPTSPGNGQVAGVPVAGGSLYYCKDALLGGFDWFTTLNGWFPQVLGSSGADTPTKTVIDMAYASEGTMTFSNVVVPTSGLYNIDFRYAFASGLFPGVTNREMGLQVNGTVITSHQRFTVTGSFETYQHSVLQANLHAGQNSIVQFAVTDHGVSRVDELTVTAATSSVPAEPTNLAGTAGSTQVALTWSAASGATSYNVYRGTLFDGEATTPIATVTGTSYTDTGLTNGKTYYYNVAATNSTGLGPDSNQISVTPVAGGGTSGPVSIDCGGSAAAPFAADTDFSGGSTSSTTHAIDTAQLTSPVPPQAVLQTNRHGSTTYTVGGFTAGSSRSITLYFEEHYWTAAAKREFNVLINGSQVLTNFDIFATAGGQYIAIQRTFSTTANANGQVVIQFTPGAADNPMVNGIAVN
jgi:fibronectin type 3 domain-containing protein